MADERAEITAGTETEAQLALALKALSVMRHDVRNLLASVTIMAGRMEQSGDERLAKAAPMLVASMERTVALGVRAGELAAAEVGELDAVPIGRVLSLIEGDVDADGADQVVLADEAQLKTMLSELLANANEAGGAKLTATREGERVLVRVSDGGGGVPDYAQADLFTPFKGAKRRDGTGLGLPLAARLARLNGGTLRLESTGGEGSVFLLDLPAAS